MELYKKKHQPYSEADFKNPPAEYRSAPFWAWNCAMTDEDIDFMTDMFKEMGMDGAQLHSRTGMALPYLQEEFMARIRHAVERAKQDGMHAWLYDEDRWPSGYGGGYITKDDRYRARLLMFAPAPLGDVETGDAWGMCANGKCARSNNRTLLAVYTVSLDAEGWLKEYRRLAAEEIPSADPDTLWYAYLEVSGDNPWFNDTSYANLLDPEAVRAFINVTHEAYYRAVGDEFGKTIPSIFTDEPQFSFKNNFAKAKDRELVSIPFTDDLPETYLAQYGEDLLAHLPEIFFDRKEGYPVTRYRYHDHLTERFVSAYADQLSDWCGEHGIALTGHVMREPTLEKQTRAVGEAMRFYRKMQLPGVDMLAFRIEYNTCKQCQSAVHQFGREGMLDELYGVTNWDFEFRGHKLLGDWQAALGVTLRVPHLSWTSMAGEAKRDYPASIGYQSPWYKEYRHVEDYFARVCLAMTRGKCEVNLGVLHPIESYWLAYGSEEKTGRLRRELNDDFDELTGWLIGDTKDFDLIAESLVPQLYKGVKGGRVQMGEMSYSVLLAPNMLTMRRTTLDMLRAFRRAGGRVVFTGYLPEYLDGEPNEEVKAFAAECEYVPFTQNQLLGALEGVSALDIFEADGTHTENLIAQTRSDGNEKWVFVAHKPPLQRLDHTDEQRVTLRMRGEWDVRIYDAWNGRIFDADVTRENGDTYYSAVLHAQDSLLLRFTPAAGERHASLAAHSAAKTPVTIPDEVDVTLSEPNVLLLDMAEYAFDGGAFQPREEILRLDNKFRDALGYPYRMEAFPQPWCIHEQEGDTPHTLTLRFRVRSEVDVDAVELALEHPQDCEIRWNGEAVPNKTVGRYVDRDILRVKLGRLHAGENELIVSLPFSRKTDVEAMMLLGDFGVRVQGDEAVVTAPVRRLHFADWVMQGLPFYGGKVTYHIGVEGHGKPLNVALTKFRAPVIAVDVDGKRQGLIAISPYNVTTEALAPGLHQLDLTVYGNRFNTFGAVHNTDEEKDVYCSPNFWRTRGDTWAYEYQLKRTGPLCAPVVEEEE